MGEGLEAVSWGSEGGLGDLLVLFNGSYHAYYAHFTSLSIFH